MTHGAIREVVVAGRVEVVRQMQRGIATLPLASEEAFVADSRMVAAGESFLRRALEALLDLGRHILAKGFGVVAVEYKTVPRQLREAGVLEAGTAELFTRMAGYRNRLVHFYDEITPAELYRILTAHVTDIEAILDALRGWVVAHPERVDRSL